MNPPVILFFGRNPAMMSIVDLQLKAAGIVATGYMDEDALVKAMDASPVHMLVIGGGVEEAPRARSKAICEARGILVLEHSGGPQHLPGNIKEAIG